MLIQGSGKGLVDPGGLKKEKKKLPWTFTSMGTI